MLFSSGHKVTRYRFSWSWLQLYNRYILIFLSCCILLTSTVSAAKQSGIKEKCDTCTDIVKNIEEGIKKTSKSNYGGGNTKWEEKLGSFEFSETRLVEILEDACDKSTKECHSLLEEHEDILEKWWFKSYPKNKHRDLQSFFCINSLKVCCPNGTYGEDCDECTGGKLRPCKGTGKCSGDGTRGGDGKCKCDKGYHGELCDECSDNFYEESSNDTHTVCKGCDSACKTGCEAAGPDKCDDCKEGWLLADEQGCLDINECTEGPCEADQYCSNTPGSHKCLACDVACSGCTGATSTNCAECANRYYRDPTDSSCRACHVSCSDSCSDGGSNACDSCKDGWQLSEDDYCQDIDECSDEESPCEGDAHCINTQGSYKCSTCHSSCNGCKGAGADQCLQCKNGYNKQEDDQMCLDVDECDEDDACDGDHSWCINTPGSYKCDCTAGYMMEDGKCVERKAKKNNSKKKKKGSKKKKDNTPEAVLKSKQPTNDNDDVMIIDDNSEKVNEEKTERYKEFSIEL